MDGYPSREGVPSEQAINRLSFLPGNCGNGGKKKGTRNRLSEAFFTDLYEDWKAHGIQAIREVRESRPAEYFRICAIIVRGASDFDSLSAGVHSEEIEQLIEERRKQALLMIERMKTQ
jgi:hypothetical protein